MPDLVTTDTAELVHVARQPILRANGQVFAYELLYRADAAASACQDPGDRATARLLTDGIQTLGLDTLTAGRPAFVNFTRGLITANAADLFPPASLVVEVTEDILVDEEVFDACRRLVERGYAIALDDFTPGTSAETLLPLARFVKVDVLATDAEACARLVRTAGRPGLQFVAEKVETQAVADRMRDLGFQLFQGYHFCRPSAVASAPTRGTDVGHSRLLAALNQDGLTVADLDDLVKGDPVLGYRVLRAVNSPAFGLQREISSVRQAVVLLGLERVRKWLMVWVLAGLNGSSANELLAVAVIRARCCEQIGAHLGSDDGSYFLLGLFSLLDAILRRPMAEVVSQVPVASAVRDALLGGAGPERRVLDAVIAYERGDWAGAAAAVEAFGMPFEGLALAYADALRWARTLSRDGA